MPTWRCKTGSAEEQEPRELVSQKSFRRETQAEKGLEQWELVRWPEKPVRRQHRVSEDNDKSEVTTRAVKTMISDELAFLVAVKIFVKFLREPDIHAHRVPKCYRLCFLWFCCLKFTVFSFLLCLFWVYFVCFFNQPMWVLPHLNSHHLCLKVLLNIPNPLTRALSLENLKIKPLKLISNSILDLSEHSTFFFLNISSIFSSFNFEMKHCQSLILTSIFFKNCNSLKSSIYDNEDWQPKKRGIKKKQQIIIHIKYLVSKFPQADLLNFIPNFPKLVLLNIYTFKIFYTCTGPLA